jgi:hypothetical protein
MKMRNWLVASLLSGIALTLSAQQPVAPPPKPTDNGPSLEATMKFIQNKLNDIGKISFVEFRQDVSSGGNSSIIFTNEVSHVIADRNQCRISFHWQTTREGSTMSSGDTWFLLGDVQEIVVRPYEQYRNEGFAKRGTPNIIITSTNPPMMVVEVRQPHGEEKFFQFTDASLADRVARAMVHATELCGGGNKEPF